MTSLEINHVRLSECALTAGARLEVARVDHPTLHYGFAGSGTLLVEGEPSIDICPHTLVVVPAHKSTTILAADGEPPRAAGTRQMPVFVPGASPRHAVGEGEPVLRVGCGSFAAVYAAGLDLFASQGAPIVECFDAHDQLDQVMNYAMGELAAQDVGGGPMSSALLKLVLLSLLRRCLVSTRPWVERFAILSDPPIARAFAEMACRSAAHYTVNSLSQSVGLSRSAFMARFAAAFGESPMSVLRRLRMRHAAALLSENAISIDQVAMQAGYQSRSSFTRSFRLHYGSDPSKYRNDAKRDFHDEPSGARSEKSRLW
ncbi:MAG TPA: helix-turn-helix transcriptional regulator [Devosiaceae bacterium]|jgi:AraC family transcriptional activator of mtrCDE